MAYNLLQVRKIVDNAKQSEWLTKQLSLRIRVGFTEKQLNGIDNIWQYFYKEKEAWDYNFNEDEDIREPFLSSRNYYTYGLKAIEQYIEEIKSEETDKSKNIQNHWNSSTIQIINNPDFQRKMIYEGTDTDIFFFIALAKSTKNEKAVNAALKYLRHPEPNLTHEIQNRETLEGIFAAISYKRKASAWEYEDDQAHRQFLSDRRMSYEALKNELVSNNKALLEIFQDESKRLLDVFASTIKEKDASFNQMQNEKTESFNSFHEQSTRTIQNLEKTYDEKLKLEEPAKYWAETAIEHRKKGNWWFVGLASVVLVSIVLFTKLIFTITDGQWEAVFGETGSSIRMSILLLFLASILIFTIRVLNKLMLSSYHLARDADERHKLVFTYLALINDSSIDKDSRELVLQSIFSRSDTGLLTDDGGPTMPGGNITSILQKGN